MAGYDKEKTEIIKSYLSKVKLANIELTKKEAFKYLLNRLYGNDKEIEKIIDRITLGDEKSILTLPRKNKLPKVTDREILDIYNITLKQQELTATRLGKIRVDIKKHLAAEMKEIDRLVKKVIV
ncbi:MAG: hypothetical protein Q8N83_03165 [Ignavibacteria bacterium]|nr:hypothetical protein [Ignavibacteria bacterium]